MNLGPPSKHLSNTKSRGLCLRCRRSTLTCYCDEIRRFDPKIQFVILIHSREAQKRIATGRICHLSLENSRLITGSEFDHNKEVNIILSNPKNHCVVLYPSARSLNVSHLSTEEKLALVPAKKQLVIFVIDGTWNTAPKMLERSQNLKGLPQICYDPPAPSQFRVRKQPNLNCHSTIEAIHQTIELLGEASGFDPSSRTHDKIGRAHV